MSALAARQLAAWEVIATDWDMDDNGRCAKCGKGIALLTDGTGTAYQYSYAQLLALTVLHLRNFHTDLDPDQAAQTL